MDHSESEILAEFRKVKYPDLEDMVYGMELTSGEIVDLLDIKNNSATSIGYTQPPGTFEFSDLNLMIISLVPDEVKVIITIDDIRIRSNLTTIKTVKYIKIFFYTILRFTQSHSSPLHQYGFQTFITQVPVISMGKTHVPQKKIYPSFMYIY